MRQIFLVALISTFTHEFTIAGDTWTTLSNVLATRHGAVTSGGACELPEGNYAVNTPVALGSIGSLQHLSYHQKYCGHILSVDCGNGPLDIIVVDANYGGGLDLFGSSWDRATGGAPPGQAMCSVRLTDKNAFSNGGGAVCHFSPGSDTNNDYFHMLGVFNTGDRLVERATLDGVPGNFNGIGPYFAFNNQASRDGQVVFTFDDGSTETFSVNGCNPEARKHTWG